MSEVALIQEAVPAPEPVKLANCSTAYEIEQRYLGSVNALVDDALEHENMAILADVLAWTLGKIMVYYGTPAVAGDVLRRLGGYMCEIVERQRAQAEAEQARKEGIKPH